MSKKVEVKTGAAAQEANEGTTKKERAPSGFADAAKCNGMDITIPTGKIRMRILQVQSNGQYNVALNVVKADGSLGTLIAWVGVRKGADKKTYADTKGVYVSTEILALCTEKGAERETVMA